MREVQEARAAMCKCRFTRYAIMKVNFYIVFQKCNGTLIFSFDGKNAFFQLTMAPDVSTLFTN